MSKEIVSVPVSEYKDATLSYMGWCVECADFTRDCTEPDAECYNCEVCGEDSVYGAELGLLMGLFEIEEE